LKLNQKRTEDWEICKSGNILTPAMPNYGRFSMGNNVKRKRPKHKSLRVAAVEIEEDFLFDFVQCTLEPPER